MAHGTSQQRQYLFLNTTEASAREQQSLHITMLNDPGMRIRLCPRTGLGKWGVTQEAAVLQLCCGRILATGRGGSGRLGVEG